LSTSAHSEFEGTTDEEVALAVAVVTAEEAVVMGTADEEMEDQAADMAEDGRSPGGSSPAGEDAPSAVPVVAAAEAAWDRFQLATEEADTRKAPRSFLCDVVFCFFL